MAIGLRFHMSFAMANVNETQREVEKRHRRSTWTAAVDVALVGIPDTGQPLARLLMTESLELSALGQRRPKGRGITRLTGGLP